MRRDHDSVSDLHLSSHASIKRGIETAILSGDYCDLNNSAQRTFINVVRMDNAEDHLEYLQELQSRMVNANYAKWSGKPETSVPPSKFVGQGGDADPLEQHRKERDEL